MFDELVKCNCHEKWEGRKLRYVRAMYREGDPFRGPVWAVDVECKACEDSWRLIRSTGDKSGDARIRYMVKGTGDKVRGSVWLPGDAFDKMLVAPAAGGAPCSGKKKKKKNS